MLFIAAPRGSSGRETERIDHVEELQPHAISSGIELEVHSPDLVRVFGLVTADGAIGGAGPASACEAWGAAASTPATAGAPACG